MNKNQSGQSIIEVLVAVGIFSLVISALTFLIIDAYTADRLGRELTQATFLAQEGLEAAKSIRDNDWDSLAIGTHGLNITASTWTFFGPSDNQDQFTRTVQVEELSIDEKKITSKVAWDFTQSNLMDVVIVTYLTNWKKLGSYCEGLSDTCDLFLDLLSCSGQTGCAWTIASCNGICTSCPGLVRAECEAQDGCRWRGQSCRNDPSCTVCDSFLDQALCQAQLGCLWNPTQCSGQPNACQEFYNPTECLTQSGCNWIIP